MKKFLDPVANAKTLGFLFIILGIVDILGGTNNIISLIFGIIYLVIGFGLRKTKLWSVYVIGLFALMYTILRIYELSQGYELTLGMLIEIIFNIGIFLWLYSAKNRFEK